MLTSKEIRSTTFVTVRKGYAIEDVDAFLNKIAGEVEALQNECAAMLKEKDELIDSLKSDRKDLEDKMMVLADKVEEYRNQENVLHNAFINAEKMKESVLEEARQTSEILMRDAQQKADRIVEAATGRVSTERANYEALQQEVAKFKSNILEVYKNHLGIIASLPDYVSEDDLDAALEGTSLAKEETVPAEMGSEESEPEQFSLTDESSQLEELLNEAENVEEEAEDLAEETAEEKEDTEDEKDFGEKFSFE